MSIYKFEDYNIDEVEIAYIKFWNCKSIARYFRRVIDNTERQRQLKGFAKDIDFASKLECNYLNIIISFEIVGVEKG